MVAIPSARARAGALGAIVMLLLLLVPTPVQAQVTADIRIEQGSAYWRQTNFAGGGRNTSFIDNGTGESTLYVPIQSYGSAVNDVPVYFYFKDIDYPSGSGCTKVNVPEGSATSPSATSVSFTFNTRDLPPGGHNVTVEILPVEKPAKVRTECAGNIERRADGTTNLLNGTLDSAENNTINAYVVKERFLNLHIRELRWCPGDVERDLADACVVSMLDGNGNAYNTTPPYPTGADDEHPHFTYFEAVVEALPGDNAWQGLIDYGGRNASSPHFAGFGYHFNVTVTGLDNNVTTTLDLSWNESTGNASIPGEFAHRARSAPMSLYGKAGLYNVTAKVDPARQLRRHASDTQDDTGQRTVEVAYQDFTGNITASDFRTSASNPYPYEGPNRIRGNVTLKNLGTAPLRDADDDISYVVYLDNLSSNTRFLTSGNISTLGNLSTGAESGDNARTIEIDWEYTSTLDSATYLPPGKHRIYATIDEPDTRLEVNETNNNVSLEIYIEDSTVPQLLNAPKLTNGSVNTANRTEFFPLERFNIHVNATDDDDQLRVYVNFTLDSDPNVTLMFDGRRVLEDRYNIQIANFTYHNFSNRSKPHGYENWTWRVVATDSFNNSVASAPQTFRLKPWPIHEASGPFVVVEPAWPSANLSYDAAEEARFRIRVKANMTGFDGEEGRPSQQNHTENLHLNISTATTTLSLNGTYFTADTPDVCRDSSTLDTGGRVSLPGDVACTAANTSTVDTFYAVVAKKKPGGLGPGVWNYSVMVTDIANHTAIINGTYHIVDEAPRVSSANLSTGLNGTITPGTSFSVAANVSDDDDIVDAYVNFTRAIDGVFANFTLVNGTDVLVDPATDYRLWNDTITTGRGAMLGIGGNFTAVLHAVDGAGNWNRTEIGTILLKDEDTPQIDEGAYGVVPGAAEIGENVTFWARVRDSTNVSVQLRVFRAAGSDEVLYERALNETLDGNFTTTLNFTTEALHGWELVPTDSVRNVGGKKTGTLTIRDNLGPKYEIRSPGVVIDGTRYASGTPRIETVVFDVEGVVASSIDMRVAGLPVNFQVLDAPGNIEGYLVTYTVPQNRKFDHLDVVDVNITARDNSSEALVSYLNFSFVVDDRAPLARLVGVTPSYRDQPAHTLNVSLASRFTLAAEDADGLPTEVAAIRFRIVGGGPGGLPTAYVGPFRIEDVPGVYTGPRIYQVEFWAEDAVGNSGQRAANESTVYVDDTPPQLLQFFPQPRSVNATFVDDRVGVASSVIWLRVNDRPYAPINLSERDGMWQATLPAGRLGDRISYYVQVWDKLGNDETYGTAANPYASFDVSNQEPTVRIVTPVEGARIGRTAEFKWEADDPDGQSLVFTLFVKKPGTTQFVELRKLEDPSRRTYSLDVSNSTVFPDGEYTFRLAAGDGAFVSLDDIRVTLLKSATPVGRVEVVGDPLPGETLLVRAQVTKAEAIVVARIYLGDSLIEGPDGETDFPMNDEGRDGDEVAGDAIYSARVTIPDAGDYRVEIFTQYREDGVMKDETVSSAATFNAKLTPGYVLTRYAAILAVIGLLAAVGIGVAVFVVMRRR